jgi:phosphatidylglycerophosphatase A
MSIVFMIFLGFLYAIFILFCWRDFQKNNPLKQFEEQLNNLKNLESSK